MAESFMGDIVQNYGRPVDPSQGISAGFELAQRAQNMSVQMAQLRFQQQQLDLQKTNKQMDLLSDAANEDDGPLRKLKLGLAQRAGGQMGLPPIDPDLLQTFAKSDVARQQLANTISQHDPSDPRYGQSVLHALSDAGSWGPAVKFAETLQQQKADLAKANAANVWKGVNAGLREDQQGKSAADVFDQNPLIGQFKNQAFSVQRGLQTLAGQPSNQVAKEVMQDMANAISQGKGASNYKLQSVETPSLQGLIADKIAWVESDPNQPAPPAVVQYLAKQGNRLMSAYKDEIGAQADSVYSGREYPHNPVAQNVLSNKYRYYKSGDWLQQAPPTSPAQMKGNPTATNAPQGPKQPSQPFLAALKTRFGTPNGPDMTKVKAFLQQNNFDPSGVQ